MPRSTDLLFRNWKTEAGRRLTLRSPMARSDLQNSKRQENEGDKLVLCESNPFGSHYSPALG